MKARDSVVIIGGGISGLCAAWEITSSAEFNGSAAPRVELFEAHNHLGGSLATLAFAGRTIDRGADGFLTRRPEALTLIEELGWSDQLVPIAASGAWLWLKGRLSPLPQGMVLGMPTSARSLRALSGLPRRARRAAWRDEHFPRRAAFASDASIGAIVRAKVGDDIAQQLVEPLIGGIQAGRIDDLSAASVFPELLGAAQKGGSLLKALATRPVAAAADPPAPIFATLRQGTGSVVGELVTQLRGRGVIVTTGTPVTAVRRTPTSHYEYEIDTATSSTPANVIVVATPAAVTGRLLGHLHPAFAALRDVTSASCAMVTFSVPRAAVQLPETGTGVLIPLGTPSKGGDSFLVTAVTFLDRKWPHLARPDSVLVRVHVGRSDDRRSLDFSDDELVARVREECAQVFGRWPEEGDAVVVRWPDGLPQYRVGHAALVDAARGAAGEMSMALAGNGYDGVGIPATIGSGRRAGRDARAFLAERQR